MDESFYGLEAQFSFRVDPKSRTDIGWVRSQLGGIESSVESLSKTLDRKNIASEFAAQASSTQRATRRMTGAVDQMGDAFKAATRQIDPLKREFRALRAESRNINFGDLTDTDQFEQATREVKQYIASLRSLESQIQGTTTAEREFSAVLKQQQAIAQTRIDLVTAERKAAIASQNLGSAQALQGVGQSVLGTLTEPIQAAQELQQGLGTIRKLAGDISDRGLVEVKNNILNLSAAMGVADSQISSVFEDLAGAGKDFSDAIDPKTGRRAIEDRIAEVDQIIKNKSALDITTGAAAELNITLGSIYKKSLPDYQGGIVELNARAASSINDLTDRLQDVRISAEDVIPVMRVVMNVVGDAKNFPVDQIAAYSAAISALGTVEPEAAGSFFNRLGTLMAGKYQGSFIENLGYGTKENFGQAIDTDKLGVLVNIVDRYKNMQGGELEKGGFLASLGIKSAQDQKLIQGLASNLEVLIEARQVAAKGFQGEAGEDLSVQAEFNRVMQTSSFQSERFSKAVEALQHTLGLAIQDALTPMMEVLSNIIGFVLTLTQKFPALTKAIAIGITAFGGLAAAAGTAGVVLFGLEQAGAVASVAMISMERSLLPLTGFFDTAQTALAGTNPLETFFRQNTKLAGDFGRAATGNFEETTIGLKFLARQAISTGQAFLILSRSIILSPLGIAVGSFILLNTLIEQVVPGFNLLGTVLGAIAAPFGFVFGFLKGIVQELMEFLGLTGGGAIGAVAPLFQTISNAIALAARSFQLFSQSGERLGEAFARAILSPFELVGRSITSIWQRTIGFIRGLLRPFADFVQGIGQLLISFLAEASPGPTYWIRQKWTMTVQYLQDLFGRIKVAAISLGQAIVPALANILPQILNSISIGTYIAELTGLINPIQGLVVAISVTIFGGILEAMDKSFEEIIPIFIRRFATIAMFGGFIAQRLNFIQPLQAAVIAGAALLINITTRAFDYFQDNVTGAWEHTVGAIRSDMEFLGAAAKNLGLLLISFLAEASPGPTYWIRQKWGMTIEFLASLFEQIRGAAVLVNQAFLGIGNVSDDERITARQQIFEGTVLALVSGVKSLGLVATGTEWAITQINQAVQSAIDNLDLFGFTLLTLSSLPMTLVGQLAQGFEAIIPELAFLAGNGIPRAIAYSLPGAVSLAMSTGLIQGLEQGFSDFVAELPARSRAASQALYQLFDTDLKQAINRGLSEGVTTFVRNLPSVFPGMENFQFSFDFDRAYAEYERQREERTQAIVAYLQQVGVVAGEVGRQLQAALAPLLSFRIGDIFPALDFLPPLIPLFGAIVPAFQAVLEVVQSPAILGIIGFLTGTVLPTALQTLGAIASSVTLVFNAFVSLPIAAALVVITRPVVAAYREIMAFIPTIPAILGRAIAQLAQVAVTATANLLRQIPYIGETVARVFLASVEFLIAVTPVYFRLLRGLLERYFLTTIRPLIPRFQMLFGQIAQGITYAFERGLKPLGTILFRALNPLGAFKLIGLYLRTKGFAGLFKPGLFLINPFDLFFGGIPGISAAIRFAALALYRIPFPAGIIDKKSREIFQIFAGSEAFLEAELKSRRLGRTILVPIEEILKTQPLIGRFFLEIFRGLLMINPLAQIIGRIALTTMFWYSVLKPITPEMFDAIAATELLGVSLAPVASILRGMRFVFVDMNEAFMRFARGIIPFMQGVQRLFNALGTITGVIVHETVGISSILLNIFKATFGNLGILVAIGFAGAVDATLIGLRAIAQLLRLKTQQYGDALVSALHGNLLPLLGQLTSDVMGVIGFVIQETLVRALEGIISFLSGVERLTVAAIAEAFLLIRHPYREGTRLLGLFRDAVDRTLGDIVGTINTYIQQLQLDRLARFLAHYWVQIGAIADVLLAVYGILNPMQAVISGLIGLGLFLINEYRNGFQNLDAIIQALAHPIDLITNAIKGMIGALGIYIPPDLTNFVANFAEQFVKAIPLLAGGIFLIAVLIRRNIVTAFQDVVGGVMKVVGGVIQAIDATRVFGGAIKDVATSARAQTTVGAQVHQVRRRETFAGIRNPFAYSQNEDQQRRAAMLGDERVAKSRAALRYQDEINKSLEEIAKEEEREIKRLARSRNARDQILAFGGRLQRDDGFSYDVAPLLEKRKGLFGVNRLELSDAGRARVAEQARRRTTTLDTEQAQATRRQAAERSGLAGAFQAYSGQGVPDEVLKTLGRQGDYGVTNLLGAFQQAMENLHVEEFQVNKLYVAEVSRPKNFPTQTPYSPVAFDRQLERFRTDPKYQNTEIIKKARTSSGVEQAISSQYQDAKRLNRSPTNFQDILKQKLTGLFQDMPIASESEMAGYAKRLADKLNQNDAFLKEQAKVIDELMQRQYQQIIRAVPDFKRMEEANLSALKEEQRKVEGFHLIATNADVLTQAVRNVAGQTQSDIEQLNKTRGSLFGALFGFTGVPQLVENFQYNRRLFRRSQRISRRVEELARGETRERAAATVARQRGLEALMANTGPGYIPEQSAQFYAAKQINAQEQAFIESWVKNRSFKIDITQHEAFRQEADTILKQFQGLSTSLTFNTLEDVKKFQQLLSEKIPEKEREQLRKFEQFILQGAAQQPKGDQLSFADRDRLLEVVNKTIGTNLQAFGVAGNYQEISKVNLNNLRDKYNDTVNRLMSRFIGNGQLIAEIGGKNEYVEGAYKEIERKLGLGKSTGASLRQIQNVKLQNTVRQIGVNLGLFVQDAEGRVTEFRDEVYKGLDRFQGWLESTLPFPTLAPRIVDLIRRPFEAITNNIEAIYTAQKANIQNTASQLRADFVGSNLVARINRLNASYKEAREASLQTILQSSKDERIANLARRNAATGQLGRVWERLNKQQFSDAQSGQAVTALMRGAMSEQSVRAMLEQELRRQGISRERIPEELDKIINRVGQQARYSVGDILKMRGLDASKVSKALESALSLEAKAVEQILTNRNYTARAVAPFQLFVLRDVSGILGDTFRGIGGTMMRLARPVAKDVTAAFGSDVLNRLAGVTRELNKYLEVGASRLETGITRVIGRNPLSRAIARFSNTLGGQTERIAQFFNSQADVVADQAPKTVTVRIVNAVQSIYKAVSDNLAKAYDYVQAQKGVLPAIARFMGGVRDFFKGLFRNEQVEQLKRQRESAQRAYENSFDAFSRSQSRRGMEDAQRELDALFAASPLGKTQAFFKSLPGRAFNKMGAVFEGLRDRLSQFATEFRDKQVRVQEKRRGTSYGPEMYERTPMGTRRREGTQYLGRGIVGVAQDILPLTTKVFAGLLSAGARTSDRLSNYFKGAALRTQSAWEQSANAITGKSWWSMAKRAVWTGVKIVANLNHGAADRTAEAWDRSRQSVSQDMHQIAETAQTTGQQIQQSMGRAAARSTGFLSRLGGSIGSVGKAGMAIGGAVTGVGVGLQTAIYSLSTMGLVSEETSTQLNKFFEIFTLLGAAGGVVTPILSAVFSSLGAIGAISGTVGTAITGIGGAIASFVGLGSVAFVPILLGITAVGVAFAGLYLAIRTNFLGIGNILMTPIQWIEAAWQGFVDRFGARLMPIIQPALNIAQSLVNALNHGAATVTADAWDSTQERVGGVFNSMSAAAESAGSFISNALAPVKNFLGGGSRKQKASFLEPIQNDTTPTNKSDGLTSRVIAPAISAITFLRDKIVELIKSLGLLQSKVNYQSLLLKQQLRLQQINLVRTGWGLATNRERNANLYGRLSGIQRVERFKSGVRENPQLKAMAANSRLGRLTQVGGLLGELTGLRGGAIASLLTGITSATGALGLLVLAFSTDFLEIRTKTVQLAQSIYSAFKWSIQKITEAWNGFSNWFGRLPLVRQALFIAQGLINALNHNPTERIPEAWEGAGNRIVGQLYHWLDVAKWVGIAIAGALVAALIGVTAAANPVLAVIAAIALGLSALSFVASKVVAGISSILDWFKAGIAPAVRAIGVGIGTIAAPLFGLSTILVGLTTAGTLLGAVLTAPVFAPWIAGATALGGAIAGALFLWQRFRRQAEPPTPPPAPTEEPQLGLRERVGQRVRGVRDAVSDRVGQVKQAGVNATQTVADQYQLFASAATDIGVIRQVLQSGLIGQVSLMTSLEGYLSRIAESIDNLVGFSKPKPKAEPTPEATGTSNIIGSGQIDRPNIVQRAVGQAGAAIQDTALGQNALGNLLLSPILRAPLNALGLRDAQKNVAAERERERIRQSLDQQRVGVQSGPIGPLNLFTRKDEFQKAIQSQLQQRELNLAQEIIGGSQSTSALVRDKYKDLVTTVTQNGQEQVVLNKEGQSYLEEKLAGLISRKSGVFSEQGLAGTALKSGFKGTPEQLMQTALEGLRGREKDEPSALEQAAAILPGETTDYQELASNSLSELVGIAQTISISIDYIAALLQPKSKVPMSLASGASIPVAFQPSPPPQPAEPSFIDKAGNAIKSVFTSLSIRTKTPVSTERTGVESLSAVATEFRDALKKSDRPVEYMPVQKRIGQWFADKFEQPKGVQARLSDQIGKPQPAQQGIDVDPSTALSTAAINTQQHWDNTTNAIASNIDALVNTSADQGYELQKAVSEGSPGPTYWIREHWRKTVDAIKGWMNGLGNSSEKTGEAVARSLTLQEVTADARSGIQQVGRSLLIFGGDLGDFTRRAAGALLTLNVVELGDAVHDLGGNVGYFVQGVTAGFGQMTGSAIAFGLASLSWATPFFIIFGAIAFTAAVIVANFLGLRTILAGVFRIGIGAGQIFIAILTGVGNTVKSLGTIVVGVFKALHGDFTVLDAGIAQLKASFAQMRDGVIQGLKTIGRGIRQVVTGIDEGIQQIFPSFKGIIYYIQQVSTVLKDPEVAARLLAQGIIRVVDGIGRAIAAIPRLIAQGVERALALAGAGVDKVLAAVKQIIAYFRGLSFAEVGQRFATEFCDVGATLSQLPVRLMGAIEQAVPILKAPFNYLRQFIGTFIEQIQRSLPSGIVSAITSGLDEAKRRFGAFLDRLGTLAGNLFSRPGLSEQFAAIVTLIQSRWQQLVDFVSGFNLFASIPVTVEQFSVVFVQGVDFARAAWGRFTDWLSTSQLFPNLWTQLESLSLRFTQAIASIKERWESFRGEFATGNLLSGFFDGMRQLGVRFQNFIVSLEERWRSFARFIPGIPLFQNVFTELFVLGDRFTAFASFLERQWRRIASFLGTTSLVGGAISSIEFLAQKFTEVIGFIRSAWQPFTSFLSNSDLFSSAFAQARHFGESIPQLIENTKTAFLQARTFIEGVFQNLPSAMGSAIAWIEGAWREFTSRFESILSPIVDFAKRIGQWLIDALNHSPTIRIPEAWQQAIANIKGFIESLVAPAQIVAEKLVGIFQSAIAQISEFWQGFTQVFRDRVLPALDTLKPHLSELITGFQSFSERVQVAIAPIAERLGQAASRIREFIQGLSSTKPTLDATSASAVNFGEVLASGLAGAISAVERMAPAISMVLGVLGDLTIGFLGFSDRVLSGLVPTLSAIQELVDRVVRFGGAFVETFGAAISPAARELLPVIEQLLTIFGRVATVITAIPIGVLAGGFVAISTAVKAILPLLEPMTERTREFLSSFGSAQDMGRAFGEVVGNAISGVINALRTLLEVAATVGDTLTAPLKFIDAAWERTGSAIGGVLGRLRRQAKQTGGELQGDLSEASPGPTYWIRRNWEKTVDFVRERMQELGQTAQAEGTQINDSLTNATGGINASGIHAIEGDIEGMSERNQKLAHTAQSLFTTLGSALSNFAPQLAMPLFMVNDFINAFFDIKKAIPEVQALIQGTQSATVASNAAIAASEGAKGVAVEGAATAQVEGAIAAGTATETEAVAVGGANSFMVTTYGLLATAARSAYTNMIAPLIPLLPWIVGISAAIFLFYQGFKNNFLGIGDGFKALVGGIREFFGLLFGGAWAAIAGVFTTIERQISLTWRTIQRIGSILMEPFRPILNALGVRGGQSPIVTAVNLILFPLRVIVGVINSIVALIGGFIRGVIEVGGVILNFVLLPLRIVWAVVGGLILGVNTALSRLGDAITHFLTIPMWIANSILMQVARTVARIGQGVINFILAPFYLLEQILQRAIAPIVNVILQAIGAIAITISVIVGGFLLVTQFGVILAGVVGLVQAGIATIGAILASAVTVGSTLMGIFGFIAGVTVPAMIGAIAPFLPIIAAIVIGAFLIKSAFDIIIRIIGGVAQGLGSIFNEVFGSLLSEIGSIWQTLLDVGRQLIEPFRPLLELFGAGRGGGGILGGAIQLAIQTILIPVRSFATILIVAIRLISILIQGIIRVGGFLASLLLAPLRLIQGIILGIVEVFSFLGQILYNIFVAPFQQLWGLIQQIIGAAQGLPIIGRLFGGGETRDNNTATNIQRFAGGGLVRGSGTGDIPVIAHAGEFVVTPEATQANLGVLEYLNAGGQLALPAPSVGIMPPMPLTLPTPVAVPAESAGGGMVVIENVNLNFEVQINTNNGTEAGDEFLRYIEDPRFKRAVRQTLREIVERTK